ncbi:zf-CGNR multi-domain protein [Actinomadura logoneensis]|uniref:Zf-CGNR multi-domain protein n=1 Tax=Actinomadura logoneensis TaxID=2293572 RepID=A0A372JF95_9ACTN|nr:CGNR zinc finger domain-containing protein [Actinomadura logoneensis]RFU38695.1 zf-CGNR multi-domain protein [Actinomadura logoneensis]
MPRPLTGEPLALDLVATAWVDQGRRFDEFDEPGGLEGWLAEHALPVPAGGPEAVRAHLLTARHAVRAALEGDERPLNAVLAHGSRRPLLRDGEPAAEVVTEDPAWTPAWIAAADLVRLFGERRERVRKCADPDCVLWFYDLTKNGSRRWCSMEICGNRAKTARFQQAHRRA